ncbi:MAG: SHOCT domain-containing protein [Cycloclasticus sp.]|nr:SHOCT domain-containing protein [Cycloclasticus sp.]
MNSSDFGLWAMLAFWASAIGGIYLAVKWANKKGKKSPAPRDVMIKSLDKRLAEGEISPEEYQRRLQDL